MHRFSLIIPTLNEERELLWARETFNDEVKKTYNVEVIVSDGGSKDKTIEIAKEFADKILTCSEKQTIAQGRNIGARNSNGEILIFLNADSRISDIDTFFKLAGNLVKMPGVVALAFDVFVYPEEEKFKDKIFHSILNRFFALLNVIGLGMGRGECHVIRRDVFFDVGGYNEKLIAGEDFELYMRLRKRGRIINVHAVKIYESPRRYRKYGYLKTLLLWFLNSVSVMFLKRSISRNWDTVR